MKTNMRVAPKGKFRAIGSDTHSMWVENDFSNFLASKTHAEKKVAETQGYDSISIYNDAGIRLGSYGLMASVERSMVR